MLARIVGPAAIFFCTATMAWGQATDDGQLCDAPSKAKITDRIAACNRYVGVAKGVALVYAYTQRAMLKQARGDYAGAISDCNIALDAEMKARPSYDQADKALAAGTRAGTFHRRGMVQEAIGNPQAALADYTLALSEDADAPTMRISRGSLYLKLGRKGDAAADYRAALASDIISFIPELESEAKAGLKAATAP